MPRRYSANGRPGVRYSLSVDPDKAGRLAASLGPHLRPVAGTTHQERLLLDHAAVRTLVGMGPHARHLPVGALDERLSRLPEPVGVTASVRVSTHAAS